MTDTIKNPSVPTVIGEWELRCTGAVRKRDGFRSYEDALASAKNWAVERSSTSGETYDPEPNADGVFIGTDSTGKPVYITINFVSKEPSYDY